MNNLIQPKLLRDIIKLDKGKPPAQQGYYGPDAALYLTPDYLRGGAQPEHVKPSSNAVHVKDGETIVLWDGSNAGEIFRSKQGVLASTMARVIHSEDYDGSYFFFALKGWEDYLKGQTSGSGIPHVDKEVLGKLALFEFPKPEQSKIAEVLSKVEQAIEQTESLIAKQQRIKTGLMQDLLTRGIDEHGNLRSEETHQFKDSPLGQIPMEWEIHRLGEISWISSGITLGKTYSGPKTIEVPYLRVANVQDGYLDLSDVSTIRVPISYIEKYRLQIGDVLMNEGGDFDKLGRGTVWRGEIDVCLHQNHVFKVRPEEGKLSSFFLANISASPYGKTFFILASKQSTNLASINSTQLQGFPIALPSYPEQRKIVQIISANEETIKIYQAELKKFNSLKIALMQDLLTGKVRVTPLMDNMEVDS